MFLTVDAGISVRAAPEALWACRLLGGLITVRLPEGGVLCIVEGKDGVPLTHNVYVDFPDSWWGRFCLWYFRSFLNGRQAVHDHTYRELRYFKERLEDAARTDAR